MMPLYKFHVKIVMVHQISPFIFRNIYPVRVVNSFYELNKIQGSVLISKSVISTSQILTTAVLIVYLLAL